ncbi:NAD(P)/FAD-dependent oxidoreductase [Bordetella genomosp. 13]|uniref:NAD(P)/FAD-dependent oxidoreductase n=1 Tax=Bordetella genomosp. 13 TaxID=463040 RepID=UPI0011A95E54|nr:FAD-dependent oxidoreductase [Bordetella genomosp. 13]
MHTVVIGNGIVGLTAAFRLAQRAGSQDRVTIIGRNSRLCSASLAAGAMLNSFAEIEKGALESELDRFRFDLSQQAARMWPAFERELLDACADHLPEARRPSPGLPHGSGGLDLGTYVINNTAADDLDDENFDAIIAALKDYDEPHQLVAPSDIPNYHPEQRQRATRAVFIPNEGWLNPRVTVQTLEAALGQFPQVQFVDDAVERLEGSASGVKTVLLESGARVDADHFVLSNGANAGSLLKKSELGITMQPTFYGVGVSIEIRSPDYPHTNVVRTPNRGLACGIYTIPYFNGADQRDHLLIGASNFMSPVPYEHGRLTSVEHIMRSAMEQINRNFYRADLIRVNVGWRPTSQDTYPLVGRSSIANLIIATGTKRDGFHLSPLLSQQIAGLVYGEKQDERLEWFNPERKPIRALTREAAIEKAIRHMTNAAYQHGFTPSANRMPDQLRRMYREDLERLHDQVGATDWGIPPEMMDMYRYGHAH